MKNAVLGITMENVRKHRDVKLVTAEAGRNYLFSEPNYHTTIFFQKINHRNEKKTQVFMNKPVCLGQYWKAVYQFWK